MSSPPFGDSTCSDDIGQNRCPGSRNRGCELYLDDVGWTCVDQP